MAPKQQKKKTRRPRRLSPESRQAIAEAILSGTKTPRGVAREFRISRDAIRRILKRAETGQFEDAPRTGRPKKLSQEDEQRLRELAEADPERSIRKLRDSLAAEGGPEVSKGTVGRVLHQAGYLPLPPEQIQLKPGLSRTFEKLSGTLNRFEDTKQFADSVRKLLSDMVPGLSETEKTATDQLKQILQETAEKYGADGGRALYNASEMFAKLGEEERTYAEYVKEHCMDQLAAIDQDGETIATASAEKDLKTVTEEMFVAKRKLHNAKVNRDKYREQAQIATKAFEEQKEAIDHIAPNISHHRQKQREIIKIFIEAQRVFYLRAANVIGNALPYL